MTKEEFERKIEKMESKNDISVMIGFMALGAFAFAFWAWGRGTGYGQGYVDGARHMKHIYENPEE